MRLLQYWIVLPIIAVWGLWGLWTLILLGLVHGGLIRSCQARHLEITGENHGADQDQLALVRPSYRDGALTWEPAMTDDQQLERARGRAKAKFDFYMHLAIYVVVIGMLLGINLLSWSGH